MTKIVTALTEDAERPRSALAPTRQSPTSRLKEVTIMAALLKVVPLPDDLEKPKAWKAVRNAQGTVVALRLTSLVVASLVLVACVRPSTQRIHRENMAKAEAFKRRAEMDIAVGSTLQQVADYVRAHGQDFPDRPDTHDFRSSTDVPSSITVLVFTGESPRWNCGREAVGVVFLFEYARFAGIQAASWHGPKACW